MAVTIDGTTGVSGVDGGAATPAYRGGDADTGIFYPVAGALSISTNGSERMRIDSSGNVGIGTSSPDAKLEVITGGGGAVIIRDNDTPNTGTTMRLLGGAYSGNAATALVLVSSSNITNQISIGGNTSTGEPATRISLFTGTAGALGAGTERFRIGESGQLGIGGANYGTSGQVLTSGGSGAAPSWADPAGANVTVTTYTSGSGTWTKPSTGTFARVRLWGGGGSGRKGVGTTGTNTAVGGGGGGYFEHTYRLSELGATVSYSIAAGGAAVTATVNTDGNPGGTTTFGSLSAYGGAGGGTKPVNTFSSGGDFLRTGGSSALDGFPFSGGLGQNSITDVNAAAYGGGGGGIGGNGTDFNSSGAGGISLFGGNGGAGNAVSGGTAGSGSSPGGGGGGKINNTTGSSGAGGNGRIEIWVW